MKPGPFRVSFGDRHVTAIAYPAALVRSVRAAAPGRARSHTRPTFLLSHGAGAGQKHPYIVGTAERIQARGVDVVTFDFPYTEAGRKLPDKGGVLEECFVAVFDAVRERSKGPLFAGGKSMGGRIASHVAATKAIDPAGLVLLGYPLHPPGKPKQRRDEHLPNIRAPMLFVQGTRDAFGAAADIAKLIPKLAKGSRLLAVKDGDHSHTVPKRGRVPQDEVYAGIADAIVEFVLTYARTR